MSLPEFKSWAQREAERKAQELKIKLADEKRNQDWLNKIKSEEDRKRRAVEEMEEIASLYSPTVSYILTSCLKAKNPPGTKIRIEEGFSRFSRSGEVDDANSYYWHGNVIKPRRFSKRSVFSNDAPLINLHRDLIDKSAVYFETLYPDSEDDKIVIDYLKRTTGLEIRFKTYTPRADPPTLTY